METQDIRKAGLKVTHPRVKILEILDSATAHHMTAEDIYKALLDSGDDIGLATVYRVLTQFEAADLVVKHNFEGGQGVYELNRGHHHDHIVCVDCGRIAEFMDETIEKRQKEVADRMQFKLADHALILYGKCQREKCKYKAQMED